MISLLERIYYTVRQTSVQMSFSMSIIETGWIIMITIHGKYNAAHVMIDEIDGTTREQIQSFLDHPAFADTYIAVMPDCHAGKGAVIGLTMRMNGYIIPNVVGVDIGCGMLSARFDTGSVDYERLDRFIKDKIPSGFNINRSHSHVAGIQGDEVADVCDRIGTDTDKALRAIGSLGGGNHFIEAGHDPDGGLWVTIHSGSRNFGMKVATFHQRRAREISSRNGQGVQRDLEYMKVGSEECGDYLHDLFVAQRFASANRAEMMKRIAGYIGKEPLEMIESVHNFIGDDDIIRKGATPAAKGQKVIIPFNMRDGIAICEGKGSKEYNYSAPHGAGRIMSRTQARRTLSVDVLRGQMRDAGIFTTTAGCDTIDESPDAYKDMELILSNIRETVEVIEFIKPAYNFKAGED